MGLSWEQATRNLPRLFSPDVTVSFLNYPDEASWRWVYTAAECEEMGCKSLEDYNIGLQNHTREVRRRGAQVMLVPFFLDQYQDWLEREKKENSAVILQEYARLVGQSVHLRKAAVDHGILPRVAFGVDRLHSQPSEDSDLWAVHLWEPAFLVRLNLMFRGTFSRQISKVADTAFFDLDFRVTKIDPAEPTQEAVQFVWLQYAKRFGIEHASELEVAVKDEIESVPEFLSLTSLGTLHTRWPRFLLFEKQHLPKQWSSPFILQKERPLLPFDLAIADLCQP
jgi:hypothetical protein